MSESYLVRIELHDAQWSHYETLHQQMARAGFSRAIRGDDGKLYQLPDATYTVQNSPASLQTVQNAAEAAARATGRKYGLISSNFKSASWNGLSVVTTSQRAA